MSTVTYKSQPGIHATRGTVPLAGTSHVYQVTKRLWPEEVEDYISSWLVGKTLHVCCGLSALGDVRLDLFQPGIDVRADGARLPFGDRAFDTVLCDPPYNGRFQWMHDLLNELHRVAAKRVIFQAWYCPADKEGRYKKAHVFKLREIAPVPTLDKKDLVIVEDGEAFTLKAGAVWSPRSYFGRMQFISIFDRE